MKVGNSPPTLSYECTDTHMSNCCSKYNSPGSGRDLKTVVLSKDNNYQAVEKLKVDHSLYGSTKVQEYVQLTAKSEDVFGGSAKKINIFLSTKRGYIFIQTDKPIYNPGETVKYRIFTLDNYMIPIKDDIHVQIINCKGLIVYNHILISDQILERTITIPEVELAGKWKIIVTYHKYPESTRSLEFEVKEYVLPTFEVTIEASKPYHMLKSMSFPFSISARYTYGKGVSGIAYIRFGLIDEEGTKTYLPGTEKQIDVTNGTAKTEVLTEDLKTASENQTQGHIEGYYLYIAVSVLEKASGNLEEAESSSVKIVTSPYVVDLSKTKKYFTPGGVFSVLATATYPDGRRAPKLKFSATIEIEGSEQILQSEGSGNDMGDVAMSFQIPPQAKHLAVTVFAEGANQQVIRSDSKMTASATKAEEHSYLSLEVQHQVLKPGEALKATLRDITPQGAAKPTFIYFMVLSKGQIVQVGKVPRTEITTVDVNINVDMVPSFRLVAYYFTGSPKEKIVADSVWVDVKDVCKGKVEIEPLPEIKPASELHVLVKTDPKTKVALAAVDSAVYILNKNKLNLQKMFDYMNSYDLACSIGGGEDSSAVLQRAGLTFICNCDTQTPLPQKHKCYNFKPRIKRAADYIKKYDNVVNSFKGRERKCCLDGTRSNQIHTSCDERLKRVQESDSCKKAFKRCCEAANERRKRDKLEKKKISLGRDIDDTLEEIVIDEDAIYFRKYFPQSWMWTVLQSDSTGIIRHDVFAPDSITTWEVQAVGISPTKGFCIAEPKPLRAFRDFFLSVNLPYSVKKNEQLQVKAVVYNYKEDHLRVIVKMDKVEGLCTAGGDQVKEEVMVPANSAVAVYFTVVPLVAGNIPIKVLAIASDSVHDGVEKKLRVEEEGEIATIDTKYSIDPKMRKLEIDIPAPADEIPGGTESEISLSLKGGVMGESVENCLNLEGIDKLIQLPTGCAEQTMVKMSPAIHAMRYLDATKQWLSLKAERRDEAQSMIQTGYNTVLTYKKQDGSYGAFLRTPSSIWYVFGSSTTAYALLSALSLGDKENAKLAANWLTEQRKSGGGFQSTQDTVVALEALVKYGMQNNDVEDLNLRVEMCLENGKKQDLHLTKSNAITASAVKVRNVGKFSLNVQGTGRGTLAVVQTYRTMKKDQSHCDMFHLSVTVTGELEYKMYHKEEELEDYYNYDDEPKDEPMSSIEWFDLRSRRKRQISEAQKTERSLIYTVCLGMKKNTFGMVMITENECLQFGADQVVPMGLVQPASAVIYDYYNPEKRCGIFYTAPHKSPMISKLCAGDVCTCAEGGCPKLKVTFSKDMKQNTRSTYACYNPAVDYVYVIKVLNSSTDDVFMYYTTLITDVFQTGKDSGIQKEAVRLMILRLSCDELELKNEASYLIMGRNDAISVLNNDGQHFRYVLNNDMWLEKIPEDKQCKATRNSAACQLLKEFMRQHPIKRCDI
ncbi:hypothetical protein QQF64_008805 [Cirrhinus molitorella]|uniref:Complement C4 gamma chain n=1 Tax=Cirrhinus molitorella TaxID=172907 RepID=A0ABR3M762_9TELE